SVPVLMPASSVGTLSQVLWNGGPAFPGGTINQGQNPSPPAPDPSYQTITVTNNPANPLFPHLSGPNNGQYEALFYDPMDYHTQSFRAYIGYHDQTANKDYLGLPSGATIVFQVPVVFWDSARLNFATDAAFMRPDQVGSIGVTSGGAGYSIEPLVTISAPGSGGTQATAHAELTAGRVTALVVDSP